LLAFFTTPALFRSLLSGPLGEEVGWRGFLLPKLLTKFSPLSASVVLGVIWGVWHLPLYVHSIFATGSGAAGFIVTTICYSIIMTMLYNYSRGSLFIAVAFHWFMNTIPNAVFHTYGNVYWPLVANEIIVGYCSVTVIGLLLFGKDLRRKGPAEPVIA
jgi:membrane protease YdiL (CAAX protease family)